MTDAAMDRADESLAESGDRTQLVALLEGAPGIHVVTDAAGAILEVYGEDVRALGVRPRYLRGKSIQRYVVGTSRTVFHSILERADGAGSPVLIDLRGRHGVFAARVSVRRLATGVLCWSIVCEDEVPASEKRSRSGGTTEQLPRAFDRLHQGVVVVDHSLAVVLANVAARRFLGGKLRIGRTLPQWPAEPGLREFAASVFSATDVVETVVSDEAAVYGIGGIPPERKDDSVVLVITDLTERERSERIERDFVANASHELRTPLATITGAIEVLQAGAKDVPETRDRFLRHIEREAGRLGRLVGALLMLARVQAGHELPDVVTVPLRPILEEVASRLRPPEGVEIVVACPAELSVVAHPDLLFEVFANLASNAAKYTDQGRIVLGALAHREAVMIEVRDTGSGVPEEVQEMLFERFFRADNGRGDGFGLGLAIVREAVAALGGGIEIESPPGGGTTMRVTLPRSIGDMSVARLRLAPVGEPPCSPTPPPPAHGQRACP